MGGGGVDGAIHSAAGPKLLAASRRLAPCPAGEARVTRGYNLAARNVIHAVGPVYYDGKSGEPELLKRTYEAALAIAFEKEFQTIAFPCISTGAYMFPQRRACEIAIETVADWQKRLEAPQTVIFCCFEKTDQRLYSDRLDELGLTYER